MNIKAEDVCGKKVIVRVDYNCEVKDGNVIDDTRIKASLPTLNFLVNSGAKVILMSHLKRIKKQDDKERYSLEPIYFHLSKLIKTKIYFVPLTRGSEINEAINQMKNGEIVALENTRFEDLENNLESNCDEELSKYWASLGDIFVLDAFGATHRNHASTYGISKFLPSYAGSLVIKEVNLLNKLIKDNNKTIIMGGSKVKDKIDVINNLIDNCDKLIIGGAMAFTFLKADNKNIGASPYEKEYLEYARGLLDKYRDKIILPVDVVCLLKQKKLEELEPKDVGYDIGKDSINLFIESLKSSSLVLWNGPLGKYEVSDYEFGTRKVMEYLYNNLRDNTILAGGDILTSAALFNYEFPNVSTGGGATLEYLSGKHFDTLQRLK